MEFRVAVVARKSGGYSYEIFSLASEPRTLAIADNCNVYASPAEAEQAGYEALAILKSRAVS
jgi:hypothetical protein